jgi:hypothetical protein
MGVYETDAFDFDGYGRYDILYWYVPISNPRKMDELAQYVVPQMKDGAVFVSESYFAHMKREGDTFLRWGQIECEHCTHGFNWGWVEFDLEQLTRYR